MRAEPRADQFLEVGHAVPIRIFQTPKIRLHRDIDPAVMVEDSRCDAATHRIEALGEDRHSVGRPIPVGVDELVDALLMDGEVAPVHAAVAVVVLEAALRPAQNARSQDPFVEGFLLRGRDQGDVFRDPAGMLADVEVSDLPASRRGDVDGAGLVDGDRDRIGDVDRTRPLHRLDLGGREDGRKAEHGEGGAHGVRSADQDDVQLLGAVSAQHQDALDVAGPTGAGDEG